MWREEKAFDFLLEHLTHIFLLGAIYGAIDFVRNSEATAVLEAILTPVLTGIGFGFFAFLAALLFQLFNMAFDTETKRNWATGVILVLITIACVTKVL